MCVVCFCLCVPHHGHRLVVVVNRLSLPMLTAFTSQGFGAQANLSYSACVLLVVSVWQVCMCVVGVCLVRFWLAVGLVCFWWCVYIVMSHGYAVCLCILSGVSCCASGVLWVYCWRTHDCALYMSCFVCYLWLVHIWVFMNWTTDWLSFPWHESRTQVTGILRSAGCVYMHERERFLCVFEGSWLAPMTSNISLCDLLLG